MASKYDPLRDHLADEAKKGNRTVVMTYKEIEKVLGCNLPKCVREMTAEGDNQWWENADVNKKDHPQSKSWQNAGYKVNQEKSDFKSEVVYFEM